MSHFFEDYAARRDADTSAMLAEVEARCAHLRAADRERATICAVAFTRWTMGGNPVLQRCGDGELCDRCQLRAERDYPQGWNYYPGDVCPHGRYVGGSGRDLMCGRCESGE